tara:strand:- start:53 stop:772 length:720 start_codon:yes stop_codon:yes gene_type:complete
MSQTVSNILNTLSKWAPIETQESWDNSGLQCGDLNQKVNSILISLDCDLNCLNAIKKHKPQLIITHHPIFFKPIKKIEWQSDIGQILSTCIQNNCSLISMHTNLDIAPDGVNDAFIEKYNIDPKKTKTFQTYGKYIKANKTKEELSTPIEAKIRGDESKTKFNKIAFCAGSGHGLVPYLSKYNIDAFITGEINYHDHVFCQFHHITVFECDHKRSEQWILKKIETYLQEKYSTISYNLV